MPSFISWVTAKIEISSANSLRLELKLWEQVLNIKSEKNWCMGQILWKPRRNIWLFGMLGIEKKSLLSFLEEISNELSHLSPNFVLAQK